jgi:hypothetical protein
MKGIAICWPAKGRRTASVAAQGRIPLHCVPRQATLPGSKVALVAPDGKVRLICVVARIDGPCRVRLATGEYKQRGYELVAKKGTIRTFRNASLSKLPFRWRAMGQMRYFDQRTFRPLTLGGGRLGGPILPESQREGRRNSLRFRAFSKGIPGLDHDNPEARLVRRYVAWVGSPDHFLHAQALEHGGWSDLFNTTRWTLFEAKANSGDRTIREAFGQLYDYRRSFPRSPSLATLLPERPSPRILTFLSHCGVAAVWERSQGGFTDSENGHLTNDLRTEYRARAVRRRFVR